MAYRRVSFDDCETVVEKKERRETRPALTFMQSSPRPRIKTGTDPCIVPVILVADRYPMRGKTDIKRLEGKKDRAGQNRKRKGLAVAWRMSLMEFSPWLERHAHSNEPPSNSRRPNRVADYVDRFKLHPARDYET